jgi:chloramphenicol O-acetyltransferase type A
VEVHHALMDGLHVGRYVQALEAAMAEPMAWLAPAAG